MGSEMCIRDSCIISVIEQRTCWSTNTLSCTNPIPGQLRVCSCLTELCNCFHEAGEDVLEQTCPEIKQQDDQESEEVEEEESEEEEEEPIQAEGFKNAGAKSIPGYGPLWALIWIGLIL